MNVNYGANQSFTITPTTGYHIDSVVVDGANQGAVAGYDFTGVTANHAIAAYFSIDVLTITASASAGGSITPSGTVNVNYGADQSFTITPNANYHIDSVVVDGVNQGAVAGYDFTGVTENHMIAAYYSIDQHVVTAGSTSGGSITPSGVVSVDHGNDQGFTITPATGYYIADLYVDTVSVGAVGSYTFNNVTADHSIYATFAVQTFPVTASTGPNGSISPAGVTNVNYDGSVAYTITPSTGYYIADVHVDSVSVGPQSSYSFNNVTAPHLIEATFAIRTFTLNGIAGPNGSITPAGATAADYGDTVTYAISADAGYFIADVHVDSVSVGAVSSYAFNGVTADHVITASFSLVQYSITASATAGGTISPVGVVSVGHGGDQSFTIAADANHHLDSVLVDGVNVGNVPGYDFTGVTANHSIAAYFSIDRYTIAASAGTGGTITPSGNVTVAHGADQAFTITPATGYYIADVHVDTVSVGAVGSYTFTNVTAGHSIVATFAIQTFSITAIAGPNGAIAPPGVSVVGYGDTVTYSITPDTGYFIADLTVDSVSVAPSTTYTFAGVTADHVIGASFSIWEYTITASSGAGGTISPSGTLGASHGGSRSFTMSANAGYHLDSVLVDGVNVGAVATYDFTNITADHSIAAYYSINTYAISASSGSGGSITPSGSVAVTHGASRAFAITPDTGYAIADLLVDSVSVGPLGGYTFNNVTSNHTIHATFAVQTFTITAVAGPNGSVSPAGATLVNYGDSLTVTVTPDSGYFVAGVEVDGVPVGAVLSYTFATITANHSIEAAFGTNALPGAPMLVSPVDGDSIAEGALSALTFEWTASADANPGDTLAYSLNITGPGVNYNATGLADTTVTLDLSGVLAAGVDYSWTVSVSDGHATVASADTFSFHVSPATGVEDEMSVPTVYALGQNYPNPFNPTTVIPFDLPERSTVTLRIFNILGVEVMNVVAGENIQAGRNSRSVDFSGLSTGAYFYKLSARGESGRVFEKVMKLVVIR